MGYGEEDGEDSEERGERRVFMSVFGAIRMRWRIFCGQDVSDPPSQWESSHTSPATMGKELKMNRRCQLKSRWKSITMLETEGKWVRLSVYCEKDLLEWLPNRA